MNPNENQNNLGQGNVVQPTPTPMPSTGVAPTPAPMPAQSAPVAPTPVAPAPQSAPVAPVVPGPAPTQAVPTASPAQAVPTAAPAQTVGTAPEMPTSSEEVTVINTSKSRVSNVILIIIILILVVFVWNIDKVIEMYERYTETGSLTQNNTTPDNLTNGFILINDNSSSIKVDTIRFYNFKKSDNNTITLNYESPSKFQQSSLLKIYIEVYNAEKQLIYKELFDTKGEIEKDTVRIYTLSVTSDVYEGAYYALVKKYTPTDEEKTDTLTCKSSNEVYEYTNTYTFKNDMLSTYEVKKKYKVAPEASEEKNDLELEAEKFKDNLNAKYEENTLTYTVDVTKEYEELTPIYSSSATKTVISNKEKLKEWTCE